MEGVGFSLAGWLLRELGTRADQGSSLLQPYKHRAGRTRLCILHRSVDTLSERRVGGGTFCYDQASKSLLSVAGRIPPPYCATKIPDLRYIARSYTKGLVSTSTLACERQARRLVEVDDGCQSFSALTECLLHFDLSCYLKCYGRGCCMRRRLPINLSQSLSRTGEPNRRTPWYGVADYQFRRQLSNPMLPVPITK